MKSLIVLVLFFLPIIQKDNISGKVIAVMDGDTIELLNNNTPIRVRLNGIDCPEKSQDFGSKAKDFTSNQAFGKVVTIIDYGKDRYGRVLGDVILPDGSNLNQKLVEEGLAWHYKKYSNDTILSELEILARKNKNGLWIQNNPIPPWDFRKNR